jgi:hypothetical protein
MREHGILIPSRRISASKYASPGLPVADSHKGNGVTEPRICWDFRALNKDTRFDCFPMPDVGDALAAMGGAQWFSKLDLKSGFWQFPMEPADAKKTAIITRQGFFEFTVMPFGLKNAPATFQRLMMKVLGDSPFVRVHIGDIVIFSETFEDHLDHVRIVLQRLQDAGLKASPKKCHFGMVEMKYLGHIDNREGNKPYSEKIEAIVSANRPTNKTELLSFLGLTNYNREFVQVRCRRAPVHRAH